MENTLEICGINMTLYRQTRLSRANHQTIAWLDQEKSYKVGDYVRLKGDNRYWRVDHIYQTTLHKNQIRQDRKVGGL